MYFIPIYILVLFAAIIIDYWAGLKIQSATDPTLKKRYLWISIISTCSLLFFFKYINFAITSWNDIQNILGWNYSLTALKIILPVGLSFHTFQSLSYVIEVYYGRFPAERNFFRYSLFVMYYPQLVAGPIERPQNLLPQLKEFKDFDDDNFRHGLQLMLLGFFKKTVIADRLGTLIFNVFKQPESYDWKSLIIVGPMFSFQIYTDFSGYSDIATGASKVMGINLSKNFITPEFPLTFNENWQRWHHSLSRWFHDYVFMPLNSYSKRKFFNTKRFYQIMYANVLITFILSGIWHGANWTYLAWGLVNGLIVILERFYAKSTFITRHRFHLKDHFPKTKMFFIFFTVGMTEIIFRSENIQKALAHFSGILSRKDGFNIFSENRFELICAFVFIVMLTLIDWKLQKEWFYDWISTLARWQRWTLYLFLIFSISIFGSFGSEKYVYFQF